MIVFIFGKYTSAFAKLSWCNRGFDDFLQALSTKYTCYAGENIAIDFTWETTPLGMGYLNIKEESYMFCTFAGMDFRTITSKRFIAFDWGSRGEQYTIIMFKNSNWVEG